MNEKETAEIRRRFRAEKSCINSVCGCYVSAEKEIAARFNQPLSTVSEEEAGQILGLLKKALSGSVGKNLLDISFDTAQVASREAEGGEEHEILMRLRDSSLADSEALEALYSRIIAGFITDKSYMIILAHDSYDVPYRSSDGEALPDASDEVFSYIVCAVCPLGLTKPELGYYLSEGKLRGISQNAVVCAPETGFMFPSFENRGADIYGALLYTKNIADAQSEFADAVFKCGVPMPAAQQKEAFDAILSDSVGEACSLEVAQAVHECLGEIIEEHKAGKEPEMPKFSKNTVKKVLENCGVPKERVDAFEESYDKEFGTGAELSPANIISVKQIQMKTPDVTIRVNPERLDLVETKTIDGAPYILIRADEGVEFNGVNIKI